MNTKDYMTKTDFRIRDNKNPGDDTYLIAMDIGYSSVKVFSPNGVGMFPSYAAKDPENGISGTVSNDFIRYEDLTTGEKWLVGKSAQESLSDDDTNVSSEALYGRARYNDPMFKVLAETGLGVACMNAAFTSYEGKRIYIETGLPPRYISKASIDCDLMTEVLSGEHRFRLQIGQEPAETFRIFVGKENIHIMPQPMGSLFSVAVMNDYSLVKKASDLFNKNVLIFDGGYGTLDLYPIKAHVIQRSETYNNLGMKRVLEETASVIRDQYQKDISLPAMQKYLERGAFRWFEPKTIATRDEPLDGILRKASRKVCKEALDKLLQVYPLHEYDYLIVTGGTGAAWLDQIREHFRNMRTLTIIDGAANDDLPVVFANVRGYYMYRYLELHKN